MKNETDSRPLFFEARRSAGESLSREGTRLSLILSLFLLLPLVCLYFICYEVRDGMLWAEILPAWQIHCLTDLSAALVTLFLTLPLLYGVLSFAGRVYRDEPASLADAFAPFSSFRAYGRALFASFDAFLKIGLTVVAFSVTFFLTLHRTDRSLPYAILCAALILAEAFVGILLCARSFFLVYTLSDGRMPLPEARKKARRMIRTARGSALGFYFGFLPWILLGILTLGVLLIADVFPKMMLTYFRYCDEAERVGLPAEESNDDVPRRSFAATEERNIQL